MCHKSPHTAKQPLLPCRWKGPPQHSVVIMGMLPFPDEETQGQGGPLLAEITASLRVALKLKQTRAKASHTRHSSAVPLASNPPPPSQVPYR